MGTFYVVGATGGDARDLTRRAARILGEVSLVVADDEAHARRLLDQYSITTSLVPSGRPAVLDALETGDLALLVSGSSPGPAGSDIRLICSAVERGFPVIPIPCPSLPLAALVVSGLPADSFVYLGELPLQKPDCKDLLAAFAAERRTLLITAMPQSLPIILSTLHTMLGARPVVVVSASGDGIDVAWRGTSDGSPDPPLDQQESGRLVLIVGGAREQSVLWEEERLRAEIKASLAKALGVKEISRKLAAESGWSSREIYRLAVEMGQSDTAARRGTHGESAR